MKAKIINNQSGAISKIILILAAVLIVVTVIVFFTVKSAVVKTPQTQKPGNSPVPTVSEAPKPIYETTIGNVRFVFESARDLGNVLKGPSYTQNLTTTEKFIEVVIGAQNKGKNEIAQSSWDIGNIVDADGRNFISINSKAYYWLPRPNLCGTVLKPEFEPVPCVKIYEVSKISTDLKVVVKASGQNSSKKQESFIDLLVTH